MIVAYVTLKSCENNKSVYDISISGEGLPSGELSSYKDCQFEVMGGYYLVCNRVDNGVINRIGLPIANTVVYYK